MFAVWLLARLRDEAEILSKSYFLKTTHLFEVGNLISFLLWLLLSFYRSGITHSCNISRSCEIN